MISMNTKKIMKNKIAWQESVSNIAFSKRYSMILDTNARLWMATLLMLTDLFSLYVVTSIALLIGRIPGLNENLFYDQVFSLVAVIQVLVFYRNGLYPGVGIDYVTELSRLASSISFAFVIVFLLTLVLYQATVILQVVLALSWLLGIIIFPIARYLMRRWLIHLNLWGEPVVIIGDLQTAQSLVAHFTINLQLGLRPVTILPNDQCAGCSLKCQNKDTVCYIKAQSGKYKTALVVINDLKDIDELVERFRSMFYSVILVRNKDGRYGLNTLTALDFSEVLGLQVKNNLFSPGAQLLKRTIDLLASFFGLLFLSPLLGLIALLIKLDSPGSVFYRQARLGRNGQTFRLLKFRSMYQGAGQLLLDALEADPALKEEWDAYQKLENDPRITRIGKFLRKFSLDELPQLWNVAISDMSLVGPRPILPDQLDLYGKAFGVYAHVVPGMTGLWQVSGRNETTFARRVELDTEYIQCWSVWLDIYLLFKTIKVVFWSTGAF